VVAVYPYCGFGTHSWAPDGTVAPPSLIVLAGRDENVDPQPCRDRAAAARAGGSEVDVLEFPKATHWFDHDGDFDLVPHEFDAEARAVTAQRMLKLLRRTLGDPQAGAAAR
jgi:dienelactone hydrolase